MPTFTRLDPRSYAKELSRSPLAKRKSASSALASYRAALAPLQESARPWFESTLGRWEVGTDRYELPQYLFVGPRGGGDYFRVGIFAGIHGDETAGVHAAVRFLQELAAQPELARGYEVYVYPVCNPGGFDFGTRNSRAGKDLNREFWSGSKEPEVRLLERQIRTLRFDGIIALHADDESDGLYAFALGSQITQHVVEPALAEAERVIPVNRNPRIDNFVAKNGLIRKGYPGMLCAPPELLPRPFEVVFETPQLGALERQVEAHLIVLRTVLDQYQQLQSIAQGI